MKLAADAEMAAWLTTMLTQESPAIEWDEGNEPKLGKHRVTRTEVQTLLRGDVAFAGRIVEPGHDEARWLLLGETAAGRRLTLVVTRRGERLRPVTCRSMRRNERRLYEAHKAGPHPGANGNATG